MRKRLRASRVLLAFLLACAAPGCTDATVGEGNPRGLYSDETHAVLGRGLVACPLGDGRMELEWRLLPDDPRDVTFAIYRKPVGASDDAFRFVARTDRTSEPVNEPQWRKYAYAVRAARGGSEGPLSAPAIPLGSIEGRKAALVFDVGQPYKQARVATGDLNGDGEPEVVIAYSRYQNVDPFEKAWSKSEDTVKVAAFLPTGTRLWVVDLGPGIESGLNYQPMIVADLDGDGKAEVILKTSRSADPGDDDAQRLTVLDGVTGKVKAEARWPSLRGLGSDYNNDSRNFLAVAHLDGRDPYVIAVRGLYKVQKMWAFDKELHKVWERNLGLDHYNPGGLAGRLRKFWNIDDKLGYLRARLSHRLVRDEYRGSHSLPIADIDDDGKEEILWGERCIGEGGKDRWAIREKMPYLGHPDVVFPARIIPSLKGEQIFYGREGWTGKPNDRIGVYLADSRGKVLWAHWGYTHIDRGWVGRISAARDGLDCLGVDISQKIWNKEGATLVEPSGHLWSGDGTPVGNPPASWYFSFPVDWDGTGIRKVCIMEEGLLKEYGARATEKLPPNCLWGADLFGDQREEIVAAPGDGKVYILFNASGMKGAPRVSPLADRQYRNDLTRTAMHGYVIPTEGGYIPRAAKQ